MYYILGSIKDFIRSACRSLAFFFGANIPCDLGSELAGIMGMEQVNDLGLYLGIPSNWGRSKRHALAYVKGWVVGKLQGWKQNLLSLA